MMQPIISPGRPLRRNQALTPHLHTIYGYVCYEDTWRAKESLNEAAGPHWHKSTGSFFGTPAFRARIFI